MITKYLNVEYFKDVDTKKKKKNNWVSFWRFLVIYIYIYADNKFFSIVI